ncbi:VrrA/YqfQ family protein [Virgibacillus ndiopensis]|uniref:VrrA/YqfQ family protein n=1 Tax=Virgibacillus ndiopensis TaxID=2004408 RepID=UPI000C0740C0|nr:VrrA/YqfQ family protein [Virgibacillus ndiopensis]
MVFPIQRPPNFPVNQMQRMPNNTMFPSQGFSPPRGNTIQHMLQRFLPSQGIQQGALPARAVGGLSSTINNVQQVLKVVQSTAPVVQQYGPMVKNLPKMYKLMKALKEDDDDETNIDTESHDNESMDIKVESSYTEEQTKNSNKSRQGLSKPKLYI